MEIPICGCSIEPYYEVLPNLYLLTHFYTQTLFTVILANPKCSSLHFLCFCFWLTLAQNFHPDSRLGYSSKNSQVAYFYICSLAIIVSKQVCVYVWFQKHSVSVICSLCCVNWTGVFGLLLVTLQCPDILQARADHRWTDIVKVELDCDEECVCVSVRAEVLAHV